MTNTVINVISNLNKRVSITKNMAQKANILIETILAEKNGGIFINFNENMSNINKIKSNKKAMSKY